MLSFFLHRPVLFVIDIISQIIYGQSDYSISLELAKRHHTRDWKGFTSEQDAQSEWPSSIRVMYGPLCCRGKWTSQIRSLINPTDQTACMAQLHVCYQYVVLRIGWYRKQGSAMRDTVQLENQMSKVAVKFLPQYSRQLIRSNPGRIY